MLFFLILLTVIALVLSILVGYDAVAALYEDLSHYHIGRWKNEKSWKDAVAKVCKKWSIKTPKLKLRDDCRYLLIDRIKGKYSKPMVQSWQKAGCLLGVAELCDVNFDNLLCQVKNQLLDSQGGWKIPVKKVDFAMLAYVILKYEKDEMSVKKAMDQMVYCIENNICKDGMISYSAGKNAKRRYVDTLGFVCPFLALYGKTYNKPEYAEIAVTQICKFRNKGMYHNLPVHCFLSDTGTPVGVYGWGRGLGWYSMAIIDLYFEIQNESVKNTIKIWIKEAADAWKEYERDDGGFSTIVQDMEIYDSSATAMLGYFYAEAAKIFNCFEYGEIAERCLKKLTKVTKFNGVIDRCLGDTKDIGVFSQRYSSMPFIQGIAIRLYSSLYI